MAKGQIRKNREQSSGKEPKTINFDKFVLQKLEIKAKMAGSNVSQLVNNACRTIVVSDVDFYAELKKFHWLEYQKYKYMEEQAKAIRDTK